MDENIVIIRGRLGDNPDIREKVATMRVATNTYWRDATGAPQSKTTWVTIVMFDKNMSIAQAYLRKGVTVKVTAHLQTSTWKDKETGEARSKLDIVADDIAIVPVLEQTGSTHQAESATDYQDQEQYQNDPAYEASRPSQPAAQRQPSHAAPMRRPVAPMRRPVARPVAQPQSRPVAQSSIGQPPAPPRSQENFSRTTELKPKAAPTVNGKQIVF
ncbi:MAG: single-stranded DNA-binding protein [Halothiobacillus sp.]|nr:single-stranded DNA-binding protein [Halothiobacillus sp.]